MDQWSEETLIETFDQLVSEGVIVYGPHKSIKIDAAGYPLEFRICPALATKPHAVGASNPAFSASRKWGPASDMFCPDERLILASLHGTHDLTLNLFCVDRPQLLLPTRDSYKRQHEALDRDDLQAMLDTLDRFPGMYALFNCGDNAGCSRVHKHLQALRGPPHAFAHLLASHTHQTGDVHDEPRRPASPPARPFKAFLHHFSASFAKTPTSHVLAVYTALLGQCESALGIKGQPGQQAPPHNVVMWRDWLIVIPRRKGSLEGASANAGGMLGSVWVPSEEHVQKWIDVGCARVLGELGVPN